MKQVTQSQFTDILCKDYNIDSQYKSITKFESFPVINGKRKINARYDSIIVDNDGNELVRKDTSLLISLQGTIIKIGNEVFISEKRKCYYSVEDYMIFDEYKINKTKITFNLDPDNGDILQVEYKLNNQIYYYRR